MATQTTAVIGVGNIGRSVARHLVDGGGRVVVAGRDESSATALAEELGGSASATSVEKAITEADVVVFAVWLDTLKQLIAQHAYLLRGKVVVDPSNPVALGCRWRVRSDASRRAVLGLRGCRAAPRPGSLRESVRDAQRRFTGLGGQPGPAALFYATDDDQAAAAIERLISAAGFDPVKAGGSTPP